jgi:hypothetical protein
VVVLFSCLHCTWPLCLSISLFLDWSRFPCLVDTYAFLLSFFFTLAEVFDRNHGEVAASPKRSSSYPLVDKRGFLGRSGKAYLGSRQTSGDLKRCRFLPYSHGFLSSAKGFNLIFIYSIQSVPAFLLLHGSGMIHDGPAGMSIPQSRLRPNPIPMGRLWLWRHGDSQSAPHTKGGHLRNATVTALVALQININKINLLYRSMGLTSLPARSFMR